MTALNTSVALQLAQGLPAADFRRILDTFAEDVRRLTVEFADAARTGDAEGMRRAAHSLAGAAGAVGAVALEINPVHSGSSQQTGGRGSACNLEYCA